jgi:ACS family allantoate permease-like MFS transporter
MSNDSIKKERHFDDKVDGHSVDNGALESTFQFSASAEKKLVRKIDLM